MQKSKTGVPDIQRGSWDIPFSIYFLLFGMLFYSFHVHACGRGDSICSSGSLSEGEDRFAIEDTSACKRSFVNRHINLTLAQCLVS
jgi:hypothetical protein